MYVLIIRAHNNQNNMLNGTDSIRTRDFRNYKKSIIKAPPKPPPYLTNRTAFKTQENCKVLYSVLITL